MCGGQQVRKLQYIRSGSLSLRILPCIGGQSSHPLQKLNIVNGGGDVGGPAQTQQVRKFKYGESLHPVRKFTSGPEV